MNGNLTRAILLRAPHHQGGSSKTGFDIARSLGVPFPLRMPDLEQKALSLGFDPTELWPWRTPTPERNDDA